MITTKKLLIRNLQEDDLTSFAAYRALPVIAEFQSWTDYTFDDALALFHDVNKEPFGTPGRWAQLGITLRSSNELAGDLALHFIDNDQVEVGFTIAPDFQKQGIAYEALTALMDFLFFDLRKHRAFAVTDTRNLASSRLLEKIGFRKEAQHIENVFFKGAWGSEYVFALLRSEWAAQ